MLDYDDDDYEPPPPPNPINVALHEAIRRCTEFELQVSQRKAELRVPPQYTIDDIPEFFIDSETLPEDFYGLFRQLENHFRTNYPSVPVAQADGSYVNVPITPESEPSPEERTHHIITSKRKADHAVGRMLVENYSGYAVAFQAYIEIVEEAAVDEEEAAVLDGEEAAVQEGAEGGEQPAVVDNAVQWCLFGKEELAARFGKTARIAYGPAYTPNLSQVDMYAGFGSSLIDFMLSFFPTVDKPQGDFDQPATVRGHIVLETSFAGFCEGTRFAEMEYWACVLRGRLPKPYGEVITDYKSLSTAGLMLYVHILEADLARQVGGVMVAIAEKSKSKALKWWDRRQKALANSGLQFYEKVEVAPGQVEPIPPLRNLFGPVVRLIRHEKKNWDRILMRQAGYDGRWMRDIVG